MFLRNLQGVSWKRSDIFKRHAFFKKTDREGLAENMRVPLHSGHVETRRKILCQSFKADSMSPFPGQEVVRGPSDLSEFDEQFFPQRKPDGNVRLVQREE